MQLKSTTVEGQGTQLNTTNFSHGKQTQQRIKKHHALSSRTGPKDKINYSEEITRLQDSKNNTLHSNATAQAYEINTSELETKDRPPSVDPHYLPRILTPAKSSLYPGRWMFPISRRNTVRKKSRQKVITIWKISWTKKGSFSKGALQFGPQFSSDNAGDGPLTPLDAMRQTKLPATTTKCNQAIPRDPPLDGSAWIYIPWETFTTWHEYYDLPLRPSKYCVKGKYIKVELTRNRIKAEVWCPALEINFTQNQKWIEAYGKQTAAGGRTELTKELLSKALKTIPNVSTRIFQPNRPCPFPKSPIFVMTGSFHGNMFGIGTWNVNSIGLNIDAVLSTMDTFQLNIIICIDARVKVSEQSKLKGRVQQFFPNGETKYSSQKGPVGGTLLIIDGKWATALESQYEDPSGLGIVTEVTFHTPQGLIRILAVYWPVTRLVEGSNSLYTLLSNWLATTDRTADPEEYIQDILQSRLKRPSLLTIIAGDLNDHPTSERIQSIKAKGMQDVHKDLLPFPTHFSGEREGRHLDYILASRKAEAAGYSNDGLYGAFSDHIPIWSYFNLAHPEGIQLKEAIKRKPLQQINYQDEDEINTMRTKVQTTVQQAQVSIKEITTAIVKACTRTSTGKTCPLWSPGLAGRIICLSHIRRSLAKNKNMQTLLQNLKKKVLMIGRDGPEVWEELQPKLTALDKASISQKEIEEVIKALKQDFHGRKRKEMYEKFRECITRRNQPKHLFKELRIKKAQINLSCYKHKDQLLTSPKEIHEAITEDFQAKFAPHLYDDMERGKDYQELLDQIQQRFTNNYVPDQFNKDFYRAFIHTQGNRPQIEAMLTPLVNGPTLAQFEEEIKLSSTVSAGGPSQLCYQMLKHQDKETVAILYRLIKTQWQTGTMEGWLHHKSLILLPKKEEIPAIHNIRPIVLVEVLRKLWVGCFTRSIREAWEKGNILNPQQHGFRPSKGTGNCIVQLLNLWESGTEFHSPMYFSSWDIKDAFPSVPRFVAYASLRRLGVPEQIANFLTTLDDTEEIKVATPYSITNEEARTFHTKRGLGQGDKGSPSIWVAVMDILLTMVSFAGNSIIFSGHNGATHWGADTAYADDYVTYAGSIEHLQTKANLFSAGAAILGLEIATAKLRTGAIYGDTEGTLVVHDKTWTPTVVQFSSVEDQIKYLGSTKNLDGTSTQEFQRLHEIMEKEIANISRKLASTSAKLRYITGAIFPKITYAGSYAVGSLKQHRDLDIRMGKCLKELLHLSRNWPTDLLYLPTEHGGSGAPRISDEIQVAKIRTVYAALKSDKDTRNAMTAMLERGQRSALATQWTTSLNEYLQEHNCELRRGADINPTPTGHTRLFPGQFWRRGSTVIQVVGWTADSITGWEWLTDNDTKRRQYQYSSRGPIRTVSIQAPMFKAQIAFKDNRVRIIKEEQQNPWIPTTRAEIHIWSELLANKPAELICTDGSWAPGEFMHSPPKVGAGVAILHKAPFTPTMVSLAGKFAENSQRNYIQELIGLVIGADIQKQQQSRVEIHTDSESAIQAIKGKRSKTGQHASQLIYLFRHITKRQLPQWVKAHTINQPKPGITPIYGNYLADKAAAGRNSTILPQDTLKRISDQTQLWYIYDRAEQAPALLPLRKGYQSQGIQYYAQRQTRHQTSPTIQQVQLLFDAHRHITGSQRGALHKLILDRFDDDRLWEEKKLANCLCGHTAHLSMWVSNCSCPEITEIREKGMQDIKAYLNYRPLLRALILEKLTEGNYYDFWRCRWTTRDIDDILTIMKAVYPDLCLHNFKEGTKIIHKLLQIVAATALDLHTAGRKSRSKEEKGPPTTKKNHQRQFNRQHRTTRHPKLGLRKITEFFSLTTGQGTTLGHSPESPLKKQRTLPECANCIARELPAPNTSAVTIPATRKTESRACRTLQETKESVEAYGTSPVPHHALIPSTIDYSVITNLCK